MTLMSKFESSEWKNKGAAMEFIENADMYILERKTLFKIMKSLYNHFLSNNIGKPTKVLELGCGDGKITQELLKVDKNLEGTLIDGSAEMIKNAKKRLESHHNLNFIQTTFQELVKSNLSSENFDFVVSSLAIHHLQSVQKESLFKFIYDNLNSGGFFLNIDVMRAPSDDLEKWYLKLWEEWIIENELKKESNESFQHVPDQYKNNPDNHPDTLENQLKSLESIGFKNVDCYYKYGIFSIYGGQK
jgi:tRNA (cmo5U34)-methyltransferase